MTPGDAPDPAGLPVLDEAYLDRQTMSDRDLQRELLTLFGAQCDRLLPAIAGQAKGEAAFAAHTLTGAANAIGASRVGALARSLEASLLADAASSDTVALVHALAIAVAETKSAIGELLSRA